MHALFLCRDKVLESPFEFHCLFCDESFLDYDSMICHQKVKHDVDEKKNSALGTCPPMSHETSSDENHSSELRVFQRVTDELGDGEF
jgi:hypothetical protein